MDKRNQFDDLPALKAPRPDDLSDELDCYLKSDVKKVKDVVEWWHGRKKSYPVLHRMALDYLTIPEVSKLPEIEVENKDTEDIEMPVGFDDILGTLSDM
ncbi:hypothetical protein D9758_018100 [Tetrapyrgos nigripes]|uniref:HAT C-terminal dimerisation domain-containing protein n=1 Tax=Tetrapyrgos nigripes TaxID=182062 RepID=A0A8H5BGZ9_9AGAR|nr:hypothetical protein D9758_018100 [Tetrapyrgos nigripes]